MTQRIVDPDKHTVCLYNEATGEIEIKRKNYITSIRLNADGIPEVTHTKASTRK